MSSPSADKSEQVFTISDYVFFLFYCLLTVLLTFSLGISMGFLSLYALIKLRNMFLAYIWGLESLQAMDYVFLYDQPKARANIVGRSCIFFIIYM